jgi:hypothetical protein
VTPVVGYWCEWLSYGDDGREAARLQAVGVDSPESAIRWARVGLRLIASALDEPALGFLWEWLAAGWQGAVEALEQGKDFSLPLSAGSARFEWLLGPSSSCPARSEACPCLTTRMEARRVGDGRLPGK